METKKQNVEDFLKENQISKEISDFLLHTLKNRYDVEIINFQIDEEDSILSVFCNAVEGYYDDIILYEEITEKFSLPLKELIPWNGSQFFLIFKIDILLESKITKQRSLSITEQKSMKEILDQVSNEISNVLLYDFKNKYNIEIINLFFQEERSYLYVLGNAIDGYENIDIKKDIPEKYIHNFIPWDKNKFILVLKINSINEDFFKNNL